MRISESLLLTHSRARSRTPGFSVSYMNPRCFEFWRVVLLGDIALCVTYLRRSRRYYHGHEGRAAKTDCIITTCHPIDVSMGESVNHANLSFHFLRIDGGLGGKPSVASHHQRCRERCPLGDPSGCCRAIGRCRASPLAWSLGKADWTLPSHRKCIVICPQAHWGQLPHQH